MKLPMVTKPVEVRACYFAFLPLGAAMAVGQPIRVTPEIQDRKIYCRNLLHEVTP